MPEFTRRELIRGAAAGLGATGLGLGAQGVPDVTRGEAATFGDGRLGARVRAYRKRLGLSQGATAERVGKSRRWLQKVEAGDLLVTKLHDVINLAEVLKVQPNEIIDRPVPVAAPGSAGADVVAPLRTVLLTAPYPARPVASAEPSAIRSDFEGACRLYQGRQYAELVPMLPGLIGSAIDWVGRASEERVPTASWLLVHLYCMTSGLCQRFGDLGLAWVAVTLADQVAAKLSLPIQRAVVTRGLVNLLWYEGRYAEAGDGAMAAAEMLAGTPETPERLSAQGFLLLKGAVAAARLDDGPTAWRVLADARRAAERVGGPDSDRHFLWTAFGPANVELHGLDLALNLGDPREALRRADLLDPRRLANTERQARYWIDVSRGYIAETRRDDAAAVSALLEAERIDLWEVHHQAVVRGVVRLLLERERRSATPGLRGLAHRIGLLATA